MASILDLLRSDGHDLKKVATTWGGEHAGPCPWCGGKDRFRVWPEKTGNNYWCRQCNKCGDCIQYLRDFRYMKFSEACLYLGKERTMCRHSIMPKRLPCPTFTPKDQTAPGLLWKTKAMTFFNTCQQCFLSKQGDVARTFLFSKGLSDDVIKEAGLGWNLSDIFIELDTWGLPRALNENGKLKKLWLPAGLVIPCFLNGEIVRLRIRRPVQDNWPRYVTISGSTLKPMTWNLDQTVIAIVESELDGLLLHQEAGDLVGVIALGSAQTKPDNLTHEALTKTEQILISLDTDDAGAKAAWSFWPEIYGSKVKRWPCIRGKDPSEAWQNGLDIRAWVMAGLQSICKN